MTNAGYEITDKIEVGEVGFALGHNEQAPDPYVTWQYTAGTQDFIWGHYLPSRLAALEDLCVRVADEVNYQKTLAGIVDKKSLLPDVCYCVHPLSHEPVIILRDTKGFFPFPDSDLSDDEKREFVDSQNALLKVSKAQESAMLYGSLHGWDTKESDPRNYDEDGKLIRPHKKGRNDAR